MVAAYMLSPARLSFASGVRVTVDGNSIYAGYATAAISTLLAARPLLAGATFVSTAISGQSWLDMTATATDVDASIATAGVRNILICGEGTNAVSPAKQGRDGSGVIADAVAYISARKVANPKVYVVLCSALPRSPSDVANVAMNTALNYSDASYASNLATTGADALANMREIPAFAHDGFTLANFQSYESFWAAADGAGGSGIYVHPSATGVSAMVDKIEAALLAIRASQVQVT